MSTRLVILWLAVGASSLAMLAPSWLSFRHGHHRADEARRDAERTLALVAALDGLHAALPAWASEPARPASEETVAQTFTRVLSNAGLASSSLTSMSPATVTTIGGVNLPEASRPRRVRHAAVLEPLTLVQLGRVLDQWRTARPQWTVTAIDLAPIKSEPGSKASRKGSSLRASLSLETTQPGSGIPEPARTPRP